VAFTSPKTWSFGEVLTSTDMNTYVRDNSQALFDRDRVLQVVQTVKTDTFSASVASGGISGDITGLTRSITPVSATSKLLVMATVNIVAGDTTDNPALIVYRDGSAATFRGDADGSNTRVSAGVPISSGSSQRGAFAVSLSFLEDAGSTSATTFSLRVLNSSTGSQTVLVNDNRNAGGIARNQRGASSLIVMEVAA